MASQEIVDGLRVALNKGESLMQAMMSFYNAGYDKREVEEAARTLNTPQIQQDQSLTQSPPQLKQKQFKPGQPTQRVSQYGQPIQNQQQQGQQPVQQSQQFQQQTQQQQMQPQAQPQNIQQKQQVSAYGEKKPGSMVTVILIVMLIILVAIVVSLFLFRDVITDFFGGLLSRILFKFV